MSRHIKAVRAGGEPLTVEGHSDIDARYDEYTGLVSRAVEVFGSDLEATRWLSQPSSDFGNRTPLQVFVEGGSEGVLNVLGKIEHGVFF